MSMISAKGGAAGNYEIGHSLRFRSSASAYLSRTFGTPTSNTVWTYSAWVKRGGLAAYMELLSANGVAAAFGFSNTDAFRLIGNAGSAVATSTALFRDSSAYMHLVIKSNGTTVTVSRNNDEILSYSGTLTTLNSATTHYIGRYGNGVIDLFDGYLSEINFIDGQALTPASFGEFNSDNVWVPKKYTGTYGTNGFYLPFNDGTSTTTLGYDRSGNGNNWTLNNHSLTAGATYDWMTDTPTNNYAVLNALISGQNTALSAANLRILAATNSSGARGSVVFPSSGLWYAEAVVGTTTSASFQISFGLCTAAAATSAVTFSTANTWGFYSNNTGYLCRNGSNSASLGFNFTAGDVVQIAVDMANSRAWIGRNNTWYDGSNGTTGSPSGGANPTFTSLPTDLALLICCDNTMQMDANFGQRPFPYTPPTGFKALCTANLPAVAIPNGKKHFDVVTHSGVSASTLSITGLQFTPDMLWVKARNAGNHHVLQDSVRGVGATKKLLSNLTESENGANAQYGHVQSFDATGVTLADGSSGGDQVKGNTLTYVDWLWKAGGAAVSNTSGSITSQVSANTTAGFSIVTYTGTGANATVGHGLGVAPKMVIVKDRTAASANNWATYNGNLANTEYLLLNTTAAKATGATYWNSTSPTSTVFSIGTSNDTNQNTHTYVAYCFAEIPGYSKIGSYTGNGSADGPFVWCGFRPRYVMVKRYDSTGDWIIEDASRNTYNLTNLYLLGNSSTSEGAGDSTNVVFDLTSNGFKLRGTATNGNASGGTYIYIAFAENPFGGSNVSPACAR